MLDQDIGRKLMDLKVLLGELHVVRLDYKSQEFG